MAKEVTVAEKLKHLYELQLIDAQMNEIETLKGELPMEVHDLEDELQGLKTRIKRLENNVADLDQEVSKHKANIKEAEALIERYNKQMDNVKNDREYEALSKELELQKLEIQLSEKKTRETKVGITNKQETLDATLKRLEQKEKDLEIKKVELEKIITKTEKEEAKLIRQAERAKKKIEERLLKAYIKTKSSYRNHLAVVTVKRDSCGGCFNKIPPQLKLEIGLSKKIIVCEHCGRILVDEDILNLGKVVKEEAK